MGVVYKAHDPVIEREVAIKAIDISFQVTPEEKTLFLNRFYREAKAAGQMGHPNIVTIYDVDEDKESGTPFIVMEFLEGTTIQEIIASGVILPLEDVNSMIIQLADALNYAHQEGVIHRDIKAANIMVMPGMKIKVTDFGIARVESSDLTRSGQFVGTPNYMSPEQIEGSGPVDGRSDLFSLGVVFYMLLTGQRPFSGDSFTTVSYKIVHMEPSPVSTTNPGIPAAYDRILGRLLAKDPDQRYATGAELIEDLKRVDLSEEEIEELQEEEETIGLNGAKSRERRDGIVQIPHYQTPPIPPPAKRRHDFLLWTLFAALAVGVSVAVYFLWNPAEKQSSLEDPNNTSVVEPTDALETLSRQNAIRIKWDLAVSYHQQGQFDQSLEELNALLRLDPDNEEAKKLASLVQQQKADEEQNKAAEEERKKQLLAEQARKARAIQSAANSKKTTKPTEPAKPESIKIYFDLEHSLPSGSFYIYSNNKLIFEAPLESEAKRVLMFKNYKGQMEGSIELPTGETVLLFHVVCKEWGVSAHERIEALITKTGPHKLKIKYVKSSKQLEVKWS